jgi:hypothetical protein
MTVFFCSWFHCMLYEFGDLLQMLLMKTLNKYNFHTSSYLI